MWRSGKCERLTSPKWPFFLLCGSGICERTEEQLSSPSQQSTLSPSGDLVHHPTFHKEWESTWCLRCVSPIPVKVKGRIGYRAGLWTWPCACSWFLLRELCQWSEGCLCSRPGDRAATDSSLILFFFFNIHTLCLAYKHKGMVWWVLHSAPQAQVCH